MPLIYTFWCTFFRPSQSFSAIKQNYHLLSPSWHYKESAVSETSVPVLGTSQPQRLRHSLERNIILMDITTFLIQRMCFILLNYLNSVMEIPWLKRNRFLLQGLLGKVRWTMWSVQKVTSFLLSPRRIQHELWAGGCLRGSQRQSLLLLSNSFTADWESEWGVSFGCYDHVFRT